MRQNEGFKRVVFASRRRDALSQCRKCRTPVKTIARPAASAAAMTSPSRCEPPGWITAVVPAEIAASSPSAKGKKASGATITSVKISTMRLPDPSDRRRVQIGLTELGEHQLGVLSAVHLRELQAIGSSLSTLLDAFARHTPSNPP